MEFTVRAVGNPITKTNFRVIGFYAGVWQRKIKCNNKYELLENLRARGVVIITHNTNIILVAREWWMTRIIITLPRIKNNINIYVDIDCRLPTRKKHYINRIDRIFRKHYKLDSYMTLTQICNFRFMYKYPKNKGLGVEIENIYFYIFRDEIDS